MSGIQDGNGLTGGSVVGFTLADGNGTTANGSKCDLGGTLIQDTTITRDLGNGLTFTDTNTITDIAGIDFISKSQYIEDSNGRRAEVSLTHYENVGDEFFEAAIVYNDSPTVSSGFSAKAIPNYDGSCFMASTFVENSGNTVSYGLESYSNQEQVNLFIKDIDAKHDIGKVDLYASTDLTTDAWILQYIVDLDTYSGNPNHGESSIYIGQDSFELRVKNQQGTYVYADQSLRSNLIITDELNFNKPAIGDVFTITKLGYVKPTIPSYANDAAADADANLPSGGLYKLNAGRAIYVKP